MIFRNSEKNKNYNSALLLNSFLILTVSLILLTGCAGLNGQPAQPKPGKDEISQLNREYFSPRVIVKYNCLGGNKELSKHFCVEGDTNCQNYNNQIDDLKDCKADTTKQKIYRDQVINGRLYVIDHYYRRFIKKVQGERGGTNIGTDLILLGLNTAGIISSTKQLKDIFSALSLGVTGAKLSFDKNVYFEQTMPALVNKMDALRNEQLVVIRKKMKLGTDEYGLTDSFLDIRNYVLAGTIVGAVIGISESASEQNKEAKEKLEKIVTQSNQSRDLLLEFWRPSGVYNLENAEELSKWQRDNKIEYVPTSAFILEKQYTKLRQKAVTDLKLPRSNK